MHRASDSALRQSAERGLHAILRREIRRVAFERVDVVRQCEAPTRQLAELRQTMRRDGAKPRRFTRIHGQAINDRRAGKPRGLDETRPRFARRRGSGEGQAVPVAQGAEGIRFHHRRRRRRRCAHVNDREFQPAGQDATRRGAKSSEPGLIRRFARDGEHVAGHTCPARGQARGLNSQKPRSALVIHR